jgi:hypothetical protein
VLVVFVIVLMSIMKSGPDTTIRPGPGTSHVDVKPAPQPGGNKTPTVPPITRPQPSTTGSNPPPVRPQPTGELQLLEIPTVQLAQGQNLRVQAMVRNPDRWKDQVRFALGLGVPPGTQVDPHSGWIEWSPPKDARRTYLFNVEARAGADEAVASFQVELPWARGDLVFDNPGERTAHPGEPLMVQLSARDDAGLAEGLKYELLSGPQGATVEPGTNLFRWQANESQLDTKHHASLRVTDRRGVTATASFTIRVEKKSVPSENGNAGETNEPRKPDFSDRFRRRNYLRFEGTGYVTTSWRYDGSTPLTLEVMVSPHELQRSAVAGCMHLSGVAITMTGEGRWAFVVQDKERSHQIVSDEPAKPHERDHVAGVFADNKMTLFVDGKLQKETATVGPFVASRHALLIGADANGEGRPEAFFRGTIRSVRASSTARYRDSFQRLYRLEPDQETTLLLDFSEGSGEEVKDRSGRTTPAKIHGAVWGTR